MADFFPAGCGLSGAGWGGVRGGYGNSTGVPRADAGRSCSRSRPGTTPARPHPSGTLAQWPRISMPLLGGGKTTGTSARWTPTAWPWRRFRIYTDSCKSRTLRSRRWRRVWQRWNRKTRPAVPLRVPPLPAQRPTACFSRDCVWPAWCWDALGLGRGLGSHLHPVRGLHSTHLTNCAGCAILTTLGGGWGPVASPVFKTGGGSRRAGRGGFDSHPLPPLGCGVTGGLWRKQSPKETTGYALCGIHVLGHFLKAVLQACQQIV